MNLPKIKIEEKKYKFRMFQEKRTGYYIELIEVGYIILPFRNKKKALKIARNTHPNIYISRVELYSELVTTYSLSQRDNQIIELIKNKGEKIESELIL